MKQFEYYVLNFGLLSRKEGIINYNIFNNIYVNKKANEYIKKYYELKNKEDYISDLSWEKERHGFEALCYDIDRIIKYEEWGRVQYEITVGPPFSENLNDYKKIDCYFQAKPNMEMIVRELIYQYKTKEDINV